MNPPSLVINRPHFQGYPATDDEVFLNDGKVHPAYRRLITTLQRFAPESLRSRQRRLDRAAQEIGSHFGVSSDEENRLSQWSLDIFPRLIDPEEWDIVQRGVIQRARAYDAFVRDIYSRQFILRDKMIPFELVLRHPDFHRSLAGLVSTEELQLLVGAVDLVRTAEGEWQVVENHFGTPEGMAAVVHNRRMLVQAFPELFSLGDIEPVASFTARLIETLRQMGKKRRPLIVLLTRGEATGTYFEDSFIARHMGIEMVKPPDLTVRDGKVHFRTINGLEPVDVIYRRIETSSLDPVSFPLTQFNGIPGIINCHRTNPIAMANGFGAAMADNRALIRYGSTFIRYYLNEEPILKSVPTFNCGDPDQAEMLTDRMERITLKPVTDQITLAQAIGEAGIPKSQKALRQLLTTHPHLVVGQDLPWTSHVPVFRDGNFVQAPSLLRTFCLLGSDPYVLPGGLTLIPAPGRRLGFDDPHHMPEMKDTWVPARKRNESRSPQALELLEADLAPGELPIGSRVAEAMFWMGRYAERAQSTAKMLQVLDSIRYDELSSSDQSFYWPLWQAVAKATHQNDLMSRRQAPRNTEPYAQALLWDANNPGSVFSSIREAQQNAARVREFISPEFWRAMNLVSREMDYSKKQIKLLEHKDTCQRILDGLACLYGTGERTLLHDAGWAFYRAGTHSERFYITLSFLRYILPRAIKNQVRHQSDDTDLTSLLRLLGSLDAYRREYRSRAYLDRVVRLFWQSHQCPSSLKYCSQRLVECIPQMLPPRSRRGQVLRETLAGAGGLIDNLPISDYFPARARELDQAHSGKLPRRGLLDRLDAECQQLLDVIFRFNNLLEEGVFYHKAISPDTAS
jgi:uncharacterized circularly permuted ATP-grasp superfamily protein/uncharacterized alpha-E superfamily protein